jgi:hypothetical protein
MDLNPISHLSAKTAQIKQLVAHCTTNQQTTKPADYKTHLKAQILQSGCAKQLFPTTTKKKNKNANLKPLP